MNATAAKQVLGAVPLQVWLVGGGVLAVYLLGRRALDKLGGAGGAAGIGKTIGAGVASLVGGTIEGLAEGTGQVAAAAIRAPSQLVNSTVSSLTGRDETLGTWLYGVVDSAYGVFGYDDASVQARREEEYRVELARRQAAIAANNYTRGGGSSRGSR